MNPAPRKTQTPIRKGCRKTGILIDRALVIIDWHLVDILDM
tara:strand:- start:4428 stop:4550 length:123 start_codon:yes stop_codon:yes gene_type:complete